MGYESSGVSHSRHVTISLDFLCLWSDSSQEEQVCSASVILLIPRDILRGNVDISNKICD